MMQWYYMKNGNKVGPISTAELKQLAASGELQINDRIWREGLKNWIPAANAKGLFPSTAQSAVSSDYEFESPVTSTDKNTASDQDAKEREVVPMTNANSSHKDENVPTQKLRTAYAYGKGKLKQNFGAAFSQVRHQAVTAGLQLVKHPFRLAFVTIIFSIVSWMAFGLVVSAFMYPVFVMGYISCIREIISDENIQLGSFIQFMRHGWDSLWHLLMMLAAFFVTLAVMLAPFIMGLLVLYFTLTALGASIGELGAHKSDHTSSYESPNSYRTPYRSGRVNDSGGDGVISNTFEKVTEFVVEGAKVVFVVILMAIVAILSTPLVATLIMFFFLVQEVSNGKLKPEARFDLVYDAFLSMIKMSRVHWKELLISGLYCSVCIVAIIVIGYLMSRLLIALGLYVLTGWTVTVFVPAALCACLVYITVFVTMTCLSLSDRNAKTQIQN